ncbi:MAG: hypothetical protein BRD54_01755 [Bacteroidetes bacterium SW_8_64_56]|nr:MAG: hypothetical protein BRD54_01755 [Bacteroidetes bacterium SW_8_64_56]
MSISSTILRLRPEHDPCYSFSRRFLPRARARDTPTAPQPAGPPPPRPGPPPMGRVGALHPPKRHHN